MITFPQEPQSKEGDPGLLWRVGGRRHGSTLESLKGVTAGVGGLAVVECGPALGLWLWAKSGYKKRFK